MHVPIRRFRRRAGVASVLAMMFLVIFGALAATMAVVAQGNMRTAHSSLQVSRSLSAAESGLVFATRRLDREAPSVRGDPVDTGHADGLRARGALPADDDLHPHDVRRSVEQIEIHVGRVDVVDSDLL